MAAPPSGRCTVPSGICLRFATSFPHALILFQGLLSSYPTVLHSYTVRAMFPPRPTTRAFLGACFRRYATVELPVIVAKPPLPPPVPESVAHSALDSVVLNTLAHQPSGSRTSLPQLVQQYLERSGRVLDHQLPYEPQPSQPRRVNFDASQSEDRGVHLIAHCVQEGNRHKVTLSSGFALNAPGDHTNESIIVTCAHTLEEVRV